MKMKKTITVGIFVASIFLAVAAPVYATNTGDGDNRREEKKEFIKDQKDKFDKKKQDIREKISSKTAVLRFLKRAAIGKGKLTAVDGTTLKVEKDGKSYTVLTGVFDKCTTTFKRHFWGDSSLTELTVGDILNVYGLWQDEAQTTVEACVVRDLSVQKRFGVFVGDVLSLSANGWVMKPVGSRPNQTVTVGPNTKFVDRRGQPIAQADVAVGHRVRVKGLWNSVNNTVTDTVHVKDYNLPPKPTGAPTPTVAPTPTP